MLKKNCRPATPKKIDLTVDERAPKNFEINLRLAVKNLLDEIDFANSGMKLKGLA